MIFRTIALFLCLAPVATISRAQPDSLRYGKPTAPAASDPAIARALALIDPSRIDQTIKTLVRFNTRNGVLNNDIVGGNTTPGDMLQMRTGRVFSEGVPIAATPEQVRRIRALGGENDSPSRELTRSMADTARIYFPASSATTFTALMVSRPDRYLRGGDHSSFNHEGFAAVRLTEWREDYNHQHQNVVRPAPGSNATVLGDVLEFVDFNYVAKVARSTPRAWPLWPPRPASRGRSPSIPRSTTLHWEPAPRAVSHYEVLWRETTAPDWEYAQEIAPQATNGAITVTLPISKDNVIFGVRAVDASGHRGLIVVP
jgi:hypothetical protein